MSSGLSITAGAATLLMLIIAVILIYYEACLTQQDALQREKYLKTWHGKQYLHKRLKSYLSGWIGNHFHLLLKMFPEYKYTDEDIKKRFVGFYGDNRTFAYGQVPS